MGIGQGMYANILDYYYYWTDPLETLIWPVCHSLVIPYPSSSIRSSAQPVLILCLSYSVSE